MINVHTLLILGAGSNCQYGFPTADHLIQRIGDGLDDAKNWPLRQAMYSLNFQHDLINNFRNDLLGSRPPSIDIFLEANSRYEEIGKASIAWILLENEQSDFMRHLRLMHNDGWYSDLFKIMVDGGSSLKGFRCNRLKIVTYNYDRSIEYFFAKRLHHFFRSNLSTMEAAKNELDFLEITHVHGALGQFLNDKEPDKYVEYGQSPNAGNVRGCINNIRVIHQNADPHMYDDVHSLIKRSEKVIFLGFSYGTDNLDRLLANRDVWNGKFLYGSTHGFKGASFEKVKKRFDEMGNGPFYHDSKFNPDDKCEEVLSKYLQ